MAISGPQPALSWATAATATDAVTPAPGIGELERVALSGHPEIVEVLRAERAALAVTGIRRPRRGAGFLIVLAIPLLFAPIIGVAMYGEHRYLDIGPGDAAVTLPISVICFAITAATQLVLAVVWLWQGAPWWPALCGYGAVTAVLAFFAGLGVPNTARRQGFDLPEWWMTPIWLSIALGVALALASALRLRTVPRLREGTPPDADLLIRRLPRAERRTITADRNAALDLLRDRGVLTEKQHQVASVSALGTLERLEQLWKTT